MGGLGHLFKRIIPIVMLICFVCLGITHTFQQTGQPNLTYLSSETINVGTEENPNNITQYKFDSKSYIQNLDIQILKRSTENVAQIDTYQSNLDTFNQIWQDGYDIGDISQTIFNGILLIINTILLIINIILIPIRVISGIILTALSILGININNEGIITTILFVFLDKLAIPLIAVSTNENNQIYDNLTNTTWQFNETIEITDNTAVIIEEGINFRSNNINFYKMQIQRIKPYESINPLINPYATSIIYINNNQNIQVYTDGIWLNDAYKTIYIESCTNVNTNTTLSIWLLKLAEKQEITPTNPYYNKTYEWDSIKLLTYRPQNLQIFNQTMTFTSNNETFISAIIGFSDTDSAINYTDTNSTTHAIYRTATGFADLNYQQFTITQTDAENIDISNIQNLINQEIIVEIT